MPKKKEIIDSLIANEQSPFEEGDHDFLESQTEERLLSFVPKHEHDGDGESNPIQNTIEKGAGGLVSEEKETPNQVDAAEYVQNAPPEIRDMLQAGLAAHQKEREDLISRITANERNIFTQDQLEAKSSEELKGIAALAEKDEQRLNPQQNYVGAVGSGVSVTANDTEEEPLLLPSMEF